MRHIRLGSMIDGITVERLYNCIPSEEDVREPKSCIDGRAGSRPSNCISLSTSRSQKRASVPLHVCDQTVFDAAPAGLGISF